MARKKKKNDIVLYGWKEKGKKKLWIEINMEREKKL